MKIKVVNYKINEFLKKRVSKRRMMEIKPEVNERKEKRCQKEMKEKEKDVEEPVDCYRLVWHVQSLGL